MNWEVLLLVLSKSTTLLGILVAIMVIWYQKRKDRKHR